MDGKQTRWRRRAVLGAASAGLMSALASSPMRPLVRAQSEQPTSSLLVRRNIYWLDPNGPEIASLRRGIAAMQQLSALNPEDPRGWLFQANIHGAPPGIEERPYWRQCQHRNFFFLPWHRMYLYWFQRILQWASGDPTLALPYWDYSIPPWRILPEAFRVPADSTNPLYLAERDPQVNDGSPPWAEFDPYFDHRQAFGATRFFHWEANDSSFGGIRVEDPAHVSEDQKSPGSLELMPHNLLHGLVGGSLVASGGIPTFAPMSDTNRAARDPIFWLHHANIDRLWQRWLDLGGGRANPVEESVWMTTPFRFFDEYGRPVQMTASEVTSTRQLGYGYDDDLPPLPGDTGRLGGGSGIPSGGGPGAGAGADRRRRSLLGASRAGRPIELGADLVSAPIRRADQPNADDLAIPTAGPEDRIVLSIERLRGTGVPGVAFKVYLHSALDRGSAPSEAAFVGVASLFGLQPDDASAGGHGAPAATQSFEVTTIVEAAMTDPAWRGRLAVTFVPQVLASAPPPAGIWAIADRVALTIG